jgi:hypothetical protein
MRSIASLIVLAALASSAAAQPGQTPPGPDPYPPPPPTDPAPYAAPFSEPPPYVPPPRAYVPAPYQYQYQPIQLTAEEHKLLERGEISDGAHIGGGIASLALGFGAGQAIQGRWSDTGWIFTLGDTASFVVLFVGISKSFDCFGDIDGGCRADDGADNYIAAGLIGFLVFHTWEVIDAFAGPGSHNRKVRALKAKLGVPQPMYTKRITPYVNKTRDGGASAGISLRF